MRDFFIGAFEKLVAVIVVLMIVGVVIAAAAVSFGGGMGPGGQGGILQGLFVLIGGAIYVIFIGGAMYLGLGIYQNTRRTAELLEQMAAK